MKKFIPFAVAATLVLGACTGGGSSSAYNAKDAESAILAAEHETKRAKAKGYEWRDTGKMIKKAKAALKEGNIDEAVKLANKAKRQSSSAIAQAAEQSNPKPRL
jgi:hypothetical protein